MHVKMGKEYKHVDLPRRGWPTSSSTTAAADAAAAVLSSVSSERLRQWEALLHTAVVFVFLAVLLPRYDTPRRFDMTIIGCAPRIVMRGPDTHN